MVIFLCMYSYQKQWVVIVSLFLTFILEHDTHCFVICVIWVMQEILSLVFSSHIYMVNCCPMNCGWLFHNLGESLLPKRLADYVVWIFPEVNIEVSTDDGVTTSDVAHEIVLEVRQILLVCRIR